jgi:hypothetical protein
MSFCAGLGDWGPLCVCPGGLRFEETTVEVPAAYCYKSYSTSSSRVVLEYLLQQPSQHFSRRADADTFLIACSTMVTGQHGGKVL